MRAEPGGYVVRRNPLHLRASRTVDNDPEADSIPDCMARDPKDLVRSAFALARASKASPSSDMTVAVLKNRLLDLTNRTFNERDYGAASFRDFLNGLADLIEVDDSQKPPVVSLRATPGSASKEDVSTANPSLGEPRLKKTSRVRSDLWRAAIDYSSGDRFIWDSDTGLARIATDQDSPDALILPTISPEEVAEWRAEFVERRLSDGSRANEVEYLKRWLEVGGNARWLPAPLQGEWNSDFKRRIVDRLTTWFSHFKLPIPRDLVEERSIRTEPSSPIGMELAELRILVVDCVKVMTYEELSALKLSPEVYLRSRHRRS